MPTRASPSSWMSRLVRSSRWRTHRPIDSSRPQAANSADRGNRAISAPYEPGSVEKVLTSAALIDSGTATPNTRGGDSQPYRLGWQSIKDFFSHGVLHYTMRGVIADSSNIGTVVAHSAARQTDAARLFGELWPRAHHQHRTARASPPASCRKADMPDGQRDRVAFGQAIAVTGDPAGRRRRRHRERRNLQSADSDQERHRRGGSGGGGAADASRGGSSRRRARRRYAELMQAVIDSTNGQRNLKLDRYTSGGKTGTAQRADTSCGCYRGLRNIIRGLCAPR